MADVPDQPGEENTDPVEPDEEKSGTAPKEASAPMKAVPDPMKP